MGGWDLLEEVGGLVKVAGGVYRTGWEEVKEAP